MKKNGSILVGVIILLVGLLTIGIALNSAVLSTTIKTQRAYQNVSALSYAEAGANKALFELNKPNSTYIGETNNTTLSGGAFDVSVATLNDNSKQITATGYVPNKTTPLSTKIVRVRISDTPATTNVAFNYAVQIGSLGINMSNSSKISGNLYGQGSINGSNSATVTGDAIMSGPTGTINGITVGGNAKAHTIENSTINKNAYYQDLSNTTVSGTKYPGSVDQPNIALPISNSTITSWEQTAAAGDTISGDENLWGSEVVHLGPAKINGNLYVSNSATLILDGTLYVTGNIVLSNTATVELNSNFGANSSMIIADGTINTSNSVIINGSGNSKSYIMLLTTASGSAITASNGSSSVVLYAANGTINISNNSALKALTAAGLNMSNNSQITYTSGLASTSFELNSSPGGAWSVDEWQVLY